MSDANKTVLVGGDITIDWRLARDLTSRDDVAAWDPQYHMQGYHEVGGSALLERLIHQSAGGLHYAFVPPSPPEKSQVPGKPPYWHSYTVCSLCPQTDKDWDTEKPWVWRVKEFLGLDRQKGNDPEEPAQNLFQ